MHVIATAGHVDHGKSTLVKALTGTDPDRLAEERRRGLSIQLGYCWTSLRPVGDVAFVDVPGHERFIATMLAGIGPVPAVLFVVAADDPWMPQAAEHLAALDAIGVSRGVLAVTRSDLADPTPVLERAQIELARTSLAGAPAVAVSGRTGEGLEELRGHLVEVIESLPAPDPEADVRLWVDRCFQLHGTGTVVTGTLPAGRITAGDTLAVGDRRVRVRAVQSLGRPVPSVTGVARVALNVTGDDLTQLDRTSVLVTPDAWQLTDVFDVRLRRVASGPGEHGQDLPPEAPLLHVGATSVGTHFRPLDADLGRVRTDRPLPLRVGDRALLRDPGTRQIWGITVLDPAPPRLRRRGAGARRAEALAGADGRPDLRDEVERRGQVRLSLLRRIGVPTDDAEQVGLVADGWIVSKERADRLAEEATSLVRAQEEASPLDPGVPAAVVARQLGVTSPDLVERLVRAPLRIEKGRVTSRRSVVLPEAVERAVAAVRADLERAPFQAPTADRLRELRLDARAIGAAVKAERLLRVADGIVLLPGADRQAAAWLAELPQPFTTSEARVRLGTSRRVVLPLLEHLDRRGYTRRDPDDRRSVTGRA